MSYIGVDSCSAGWLIIELAEDAWTTAVEPDFEAVWSRVRGARQVLVTVPIGLRRSGERERRCDVRARDLLGRRGAAVAAAPCRAVLQAPDYDRANEINRERTGRGVSPQSWALVDRIRQVDDALRTMPVARGRIRETHPEVAFWGLNAGIPMTRSKKSKDGFSERMDVVARREEAAEAVVDSVLQEYRRKDVGRDDVLDALAAAVTARLAGTDLRTLPRLPERDAFGLPMEMTYFGE